MLRRSFVALVVASACGAALAGCSDPVYHVIVQSPPQTFLGQRRFAVLPIDYTGLMVGHKPEPIYLAEKDASQQASFREDKAALNDKFLERLRGHALEAHIEVVPATGPADAPFMIKPIVHFIEPGFFVGVAGGSSLVRMNVRILAPDGRILDELELAHGTDPSSGVGLMGFSIPANPSSGGRLRKDGEALGETLAEYLAARVAGR
jgi:hypothetical protein